MTSTAHVAILFPQPIFLACSVHQNIWHAAIRTDPCCAGNSKCLASDVSDDSWCIPTLHVYLHLEAVFPAHLQRSYFPKKRFQGRQFAPACSVSPWVRAGALPSMQEAAASLATQLRIINYLDDLCSGLRCSLPQILAVYRQDSVIPTQLPIFGCQTSL